MLREVRDYFLVDMHLKDLWELIYPEHLLPAALLLVLLVLWFKSFVLAWTEKGPNGVKYPKYGLRRNLGRLFAWLSFAAALFVWVYFFSMGHMMMPSWLPGVEEPVVVAVVDTTAVSPGGFVYDNEYPVPSELLSSLPLANADTTAVTAAAKTALTAWWYSDYVIVPFIVIVSWLLLYFFWLRRKSLSLWYGLAMSLPLAAIWLFRSDLLEKIGVSDDRSLLDILTSTKVLVSLSWAVVTISLYSYLNKQGRFKYRRFRLYYAVLFLFILVSYWLDVTHGFRLSWSIIGRSIIMLILVIGSMEMITRAYALRDWAPKESEESVFPIDVMKQTDREYLTIRDKGIKILKEENEQWRYYRHWPGIIGAFVFSVPVIIFWLITYFYPLREIPMFYAILSWLAVIGYLLYSLYRHWHNYQLWGECIKEADQALDEDKRRELYEERLKRWPEIMEDYQAYADNKLSGLYSNSVWQYLLGHLALVGVKLRWWYILLRYRKERQLFEEVSKQGELRPLSSEEQLAIREQCLRRWRPEIMEDYQEEITDPGLVDNLWQRMLKRYRDEGGRNQSRFRWSLGMLVALSIYIFFLHNYIAYLAIGLWFKAVFHYLKPLLNKWFVHYFWSRDMRHARDEEIAIEETYKRKEGIIRNKLKRRVSAGHSLSREQIDELWDEVREKYAAHTSKTNAYTWKAVPVLAIASAALMPFLPPLFDVALLMVVLLWLMIIGILIAGFYTVPMRRRAVFLFFGRPIRAADFMIYTPEGDDWADNGGNSTWLPSFLYPFISLRFMYHLVTEITIQTPYFPTRYQEEPEDGTTDQGLMTDEERRDQVMRSMPAGEISFYVRMYLMLNEDPIVSLNLSESDREDLPGLAGRAVEAYMSGRVRTMTLNQAMYFPFFDIKNGSIIKDEDEKMSRRVELRNRLDNNIRERMGAHLTDFDVIDPEPSQNIKDAMNELTQLDVEKQKAKILRQIALIQGLAEGDYRSALVERFAKQLGLTTREAIGALTMFIKYANVKNISLDGGLSTEDLRQIMEQMSGKLLKAGVGGTDTEGGTKDID